ncbi:MAG TPA: hypothetical protein VI815_00855 [Candidatus Nanoarchaeia archaeon]|nr:hypothetical protein [Candidatus Nanoarchaeia archaeon]
MAVTITEILQQWADYGIFYYVLPFLLIFALVFAILQKVKVMGKENEGRGINAVIALAVALLSLQFDYVPLFFSVIFPKLGMGLAILLVALILIGLFVDYTQYRGQMYIFLGIGGVTAGIVVLSTLSDYSWWTGSFWHENISAIVALGIIIGFVAIVINSSKPAGHKSIMFQKFDDH